MRMGNLGPAPFLPDADAVVGRVHRGWGEFGGDVNGM